MERGRGNVYVLKILLVGLVTVRRRRQLSSRMLLKRRRFLDLYYGHDD
jgi:hypothetical protein